MTRACAAMITVASLVGTIACTQPAAPPAIETPVDTAAEVAAVTTIGNGWFDAFNAGDVEKLVSLYTDDARISPPHAAVATGQAAIRAFFTADTAAAKAAGLKTVNGPASAEVSGDVGYHGGLYTFTDASGATVESGSYLTAFKKVNGRWLIQRDIWNSDRPLPAPASK